MDSRGNIREIQEDEVDRAIERGLIPIPDSEVETVRAMSKPERRRWYKAALARHPLAPIPGDSEGDRRARKNARKRARRGQH